MIAWRGAIVAALKEGVLVRDGGFVAKRRQRLAKRGPERMHQLRRMFDIRRMKKEIGRRGLLPLREFGKPHREKFCVLRHIVAADKPHHRMLRRDERVHRHFGLFPLRVDDRRTVGKGGMHRAAVEDYTFLMIHLFNLFITHHKPHAKSNLIHTIFYKNSIGW